MTDGPTAMELLGRIEPDWLLETHVARPLFAARREGLTGVLTVDEESVTTRIHLAEGEVVFVDRGPLAETLGRMLVRQGVIELDEYLLILDRMAQTPEGEALKRFGEVAFELGMLSPNEIHRALALQVESKLRHCLQLDEGFWHFDAGEPPDPSSRFPVRLERALRTALLDDPASHRWHDLLAPKRTHVVRVNGDPNALGQRFGASPPELRFLRQVDGQPLGDALRSSVLEPNTIGSVLAALVLAGAITLEHHKSDRLDARATARLRARHQKKKARKQAEERGRRAHEAAETLRKEMKRRSQNKESEPKPRLDAERVFEEGRKHLRRGATPAALESFDRATQLMPEAAEYALYASWCRFVEEKDPVHRSVHEQELRARVLEALKQDRRLAFGHYVQGRLFLMDEDLEAAERAFRVATKMDKGDLEATRYLRIVQRRLTE